MSDNNTPVRDQKSDTVHTDADGKRYTLKTYIYNGKPKTVKYYLRSGTRGRKKKDHKRELRAKLSQLSDEECEKIMNYIKTLSINVSDSVNDQVV